MLHVQMLKFNARLLFQLQLPANTRVMREQVIGQVLGALLPTWETPAVLDLGEVTQWMMRALFVSYCLSNTLKQNHKHSLLKSSAETQPHPRDRTQSLVIAASSFFPLPLSPPPMKREQRTIAFSGALRTKSMSGSNNKIPNHVSFHCERLISQL